MSCATYPQLNLVEKLGGEVTYAVNLSKQEASTYIAELIAARPARPARPNGEITVKEAGVYENANGVFVVKPNKEKTRLYAKKLVEIDGQRLTEFGQVVRIEFEYDKGAIFHLKPEDKMPLDRAKKLTVRYGRCIVCGRALKDATSVERGIGPVCIKSFSVGAPSLASATPRGDTRQTVLI